MSKKIFNEKVKKKKSMTHFNAQGQQLTGDKVQVEIIT